jgi:CAAX prenyl protease-like protein
MSPKQISVEGNDIGTKSAAGQGTAAYVAPFAVFIAMLALRRWLPLTPEWFVTLRAGLVAVTLAAVSRRVIPRRISYPFGSVLMGVAVCLVWVGPELLWPDYRHFWLFQNAVTGSAVSSLPAYLKTSLWFKTVRVVESATLIPILEELFWRGWLMRWLIRQDFLAAPIGQYSGASFWVVAVLFASEHGPYWEVGLIAGVAYNWWVMRTRNLGDCMLAHGVTNALLAWFVLGFDQWQYWL